MSKLDRFIKLLSVVFIVSLLGGCIKPCQVDWYRGCAENQEETRKAQQRIEDAYNKKLEESGKKNSDINEKTNNL